MMTSCPFRVTLGPFRATLASWGKTLCLLGPQEHATRATLAHNCLPKPPQALDDVMSVLGDVMGLPRPTSWWKGHNLPGYGFAKMLMVERPPFLLCNPLICLCPLLGSQHPSGGLSTPWRSELIISPCVPVHLGTCHWVWSCNINRYAFHGLISHMDHSNVNHI
jgi:hypothetical protein